MSDSFEPDFKTQRAKKVCFVGSRLLNSEFGLEPSETRREPP